MKKVNSVNDRLYAMTQSELKSVHAGGFLLEGTIWLIAAIKGSSDKLSDTEDEFCGEDQTFSRRHGVCY